LRWARGFGAPETKAAFVQARDLAETIGGGPERIVADFGLWSASLVSGDRTTLQELADAFLRNAERWSDLPEGGLAHRVYGTTCWFMGDFIKARLHLERACACYDSERDGPLAYRFGTDFAVAAMAYLPVTLWPLGIGDGARHLVEQVITHALGTKHIPTIVYAHALASLFEMVCRDHRRSALYFQAYLDLAREHGMAEVLVYGAFHEGWLRWHAGDHDAGVAQMHDALAHMRQRGMSVYTPVFEVLLAEAEAAADRCDAALAIIDADLEKMIQTGQCWYLAEAHRVRGELLSKAWPADGEAAEGAFVRAIEVARDQSAKRFELRAAMRLAQLWAKQGKPREPQNLLAILDQGLADGSDMDGFATMAM
jgi:predicted ATPase